MSDAVRPGAARRPVYLLIIIVFSGALLAGCGKKGPLYMPDKKPAPDVVAPVETPAHPPADSLQP